MVQLENDGDNVYINCAACQRTPDHLVFGTGDWQRWCAATLKKMVSSNSFKGKAVAAAMPSEDVFVDQIKVARSAGSSLDRTILDKVKNKLSFDPSGAMVNHVVADDSANMEYLDVVVMVAERQKVERNLAIYEAAGLQVGSISVWPLAITNSYKSFFGRRESDAHLTALLIEIGQDHSNIVICRRNNLLFARTIPIGSRELSSQGQSVAQKLIMETTSCCRYFESLLGGSRIQRMIFLARQDTDQALCHTMAEFAQSMQVPAQIGDVFAAIEYREGSKVTMDRELLHNDWSTVFGLSLASVKELEKV